MKKIGFQGDWFSNNHNASLQYAARQQMELEGVPLINSYPVLQALVGGEIDFGVVAIHNSIAGVVKETEEAMQIFGSLVKEVAEITLPIHHCLYRLPDEEGEIQRIYSHEQALRQCEAYLASNYPQAMIRTEKDTSLAALNLTSGKYEAGSGVICNKECGTHYGLKLIGENIETDANNRTTFKVYVRTDAEK